MKRPGFAILMFAAVLVVSGAGCGQLWDKYVLGIDEERDSERSQQRYEMEERRRAEEEAKKQAEIDARRPAPTRAYAELAAMTPDEIRAAAPILIPILTLDIQRFPFPADQFRLAQPDQCETEHYHAAVGYTLELHAVGEPANPCGFGYAVTIEQVDTEAIIKWLSEGPKALRR